MRLNIPFPGICVKEARLVSYFEFCIWNFPDGPDWGMAKAIVV